MAAHTSRRDFIAGFGAAALSTSSLFGQEHQPTAQGIEFGYTAMTWGKDERGAIDDIAAVGFRGIQFRGEALTEFKPAELHPLLQQKQLTFVALSSGDVSLDAGPESGQIEQHVSHAKFVKDAGGLYLQILDQLKPYPRRVTSDECKRLGQLLTELGKRTADIGIPLAYHNHLNTISEHPENLKLVLESSDPKYVKLELDTAHYLAGGGDPAHAITEYKDRLLFLHLKDVIDIPLNTPGARYPFKFVELGRGKVNFTAVFTALNKINYRGWAVVELDRVPDKSRTPKECATISRDYLQQKFGAKFP
ncbi:MAG: TIM barrel protein, partial [Acidobacteriaceae bacterium]|nr:TIM barrel protein [Acidobacteriaceae bacterium]